MIALDRLTKVYGAGERVLDDISLQVDPARQHRIHCGIEVQPCSVQSARAIVLHPAAIRLLRLADELLYLVIADRGIVPLQRR